MKVLHTSDLHLGRYLSEASLYENQEDILNKIVNIVKEEKVDIVLIAGDIYDKNIPSVDAVNLFNRFLNSLNETKTEIIIISGNHDSNDRLSFGADIFDRFNIHIDTHYNGKMKKYSYDDVDIYTLPFIKPFHLKNLMSEKEYESITNTTAMMKWVLDQESLDKKKRNILVAHQFFMNGGESLELSESESLSNIGTLDAIDVNLLDDFDYVALGHIHKPQKVKRETIRYSGTPLKYSFSEAHNNNSVVIYDTIKNDISFVPLIPKRDLKIIRGTLNEVMNMEPCDDFIRVELEDEDTLISPMDEIRRRFPNALSLDFINRRNSDTEQIFGEIKENLSPLALFEEFYQKQNDKEMSNEQKEIITELLDELEVE